MPSFRRTPESSLFRRFWTPAFAGVTGRENVIIFGNCYKRAANISDMISMHAAQLKFRATKRVAC
jgi:hypothetical protein